MQADDDMSKVPAVTPGFWIIKIFATTLGETGGDAVSMTLNWGYALSSVMFIGIFAAAVAAQIAAIHDYGASAARRTACVAKLISFMAVTAD